MTPSGGQRLGQRMSYTLEIVSMVAEAEGSDPTEVEPPLADVIDVEALEQFMQSASTGARVSFEYAGRMVEVCADGTIVVDPCSGVEETS